jgi:HPt (histidine-containing phosphotransfer) domain-containing protein
MAVPFDRNRLLGLMGGDEAAVDELVALAASAIPPCVADLTEGSPNSDEAARLAHQLKGVSANVGAEELAAAARDLESELRAGWTPAARHLAQLLPTMLQRLREAWGSQS